MVITQDIRRRCIIGAVYNDAIHISGTPSLPPIIPRIDNELKKNITHLLTSYDIEKDKVVQAKRADIRSYKLWGGVADLREAKRLQYELDKYIAGHICVTPQEAEMQVSNLSFCRGIKSIEISTPPPLDYNNEYTTAIIARTCPIIIQGSENGITNTMNGTHLGEYRISIDTARRDLYNSIRISRYLNKGISFFTYGRIHPHINSNICWGGFINILSDVITQMKVDVLLAQIVQYLATYNRASPYHRLSSFKGGGCYYCGYRP
jgi:hypothetical protein